MTETQAKKRTARKIGRPRHQPTEETRTKAANLASAGLAFHEIAQKIGISVPTLRRSYKNELQQGALTGKINVLNSLYQLATDPDKPSVSAIKLYLEVVCGVSTSTARVDKGKKEITQENAQEAAKGIFAASTPPHLVVSND